MDACLLLGAGPFFSPDTSVSIRGEFGSLADNLCSYSYYRLHWHYFLFDYCE